MNTDEEPGCNLCIETNGNLHLSSLVMNPCTEDKNLTNRKITRDNDNDNIHQTIVQSSTLPQTLTIQLIPIPV